MKNISLDHAHLFTSDLSATITFFIKCFNAEVIWDEEAAGVRNVRIKIGRSFIHLYDQAPKAPRGGAIHHLGIETDDLEDLVLHLRSHGIALKNGICPTSACVSQYVDASFIHAPHVNQLPGQTNALYRCAAWHGKIHQVQALLERHPRGV